MRRYRRTHPPTCDDTPEDVRSADLDYPADPPGTFVVSGPLVRGGVVRSTGPGRPFTRAAARSWVRATYGEVLGSRETATRWAHVVWKPTHPRGRFTPPKR